MFTNFIIPAYSVFCEGRNRVTFTEVTAPKSYTSTNSIISANIEFNRCCAWESALQKSCGHFTTAKNLCQRRSLVYFGDCKQKSDSGKQTFEQIPLTFYLFAGKIDSVLCTVDWGVWPQTVSFISGESREQAFCASWRFTCADIIRLWRS
jgi:hypothetical protein